MLRLGVSLILTVASIAWIAAPAGSQPSVPPALSTIPAFFSGNTYQQLSILARGMYVIGVIDALNTAESEYANTPGTFEYCFAHGKFSREAGGAFTIGQAEAIVTKFVQDHPEDWTYSMAGLVIVAITTACNSPL